mmetsp:Transcript_19473/g.40796  ORF Transcript_19473/g.40796 Transcript_19473/m.40796 type:complete len:160 (+) Transcript_19473:2804-3283(+)
MRLCSVIAANTCSVVRSFPALDGSSSNPLNSQRGSVHLLSWIQVVSSGHLVPVPSWKAFKSRRTVSFESQYSSHFVSRQAYLHNVEWIIQKPLHNGGFATALHPTYNECYEWSRTAEGIFVEGIDFCNEREEFIFVLRKELGKPFVRNSCFILTALQFG